MLHDFRVDHKVLRGQQLWEVLGFKSVRPRTSGLISQPHGGGKF
jgi:hypothetical protein